MCIALCYKVIALCDKLTVHSLPHRYQAITSVRRGCKPWCLHCSISPDCNSYIWTVSSNRSIQYCKVFLSSSAYHDILVDDVSQMSSSIPRSRSSDRGRSRKRIVDRPLRAGVSRATALPHRAARCRSRACAWAARRERPRPSRTNATVTRTSRDRWLKGHRVELCLCRVTVGVGLCPIAPRAEYIRGTRSGRRSRASARAR